MTDFQTLATMSRINSRQTTTWADVWSGTRMVHLLGGETLTVTETFRGSEWVRFEGSDADCLTSDYVVVD